MAGRGYPWYSGTPWPPPHQHGSLPLMVILFLAWAVVIFGAIRRSKWTVPAALGSLVLTLGFFVFN